MKEGQVGTFDTFVEEWKSLKREKEEEKKIAEEYYTKNMPLMIHYFLSKHEDLKKRLEDEERYMILTVGTQYQPIVLSIHLMQPTEILLLHTEQTRNQVDIICSMIDLPPSRINREVIQFNNVAGVYKYTHSTYKKWGQPKAVYVDITGGTKAMAAAAGMAGGMIGAQLIYISSSYDKEKGCTVPGSENMVFLENPISTFGTLDMEKAIELYNRNNYTEAIRKLQEINKSVGDGDVSYEAGLFVLVCQAYKGWNELNFKAAGEHIETAITRIEKLNRNETKHALYEKLDTLKKHESILKQVEEGIEAFKKSEDSIQILKNTSFITGMLFTLYSCVERLARANTYDIASLMLYRILEMISQHRLAHLGIDHEKATQRKDPKSISEKMNFTKDIDNWVCQFNKANEKSIPYKLVYTAKGKNRLALMDGWTILSTYKDEIFDTQQKNTNQVIMSTMVKIMNAKDVRNKGIYSHGYETIDMNKFSKLKETTKDILKNYCQLNGLNFEELVEEYQFLEL